MNNKLTLQPKDTEEFVTIPRRYVERMEEMRKDFISLQESYERVFDDRNEVLFTLREYVRQSEALMKLPFDRTEPLERAMKVMVITPHLYDSMESMGYDMSIYHRDALLPASSSTSKVEPT